MEHLPESIMKSPFSSTGSSLRLEIKIFFFVFNILVAASIFPNVDDATTTGSKDMFRELIFLRSVESVIYITVLLSMHI